jgi:hypothetical protein
MYEEEGLGAPGVVAVVPPIVGGGAGGLGVGAGGSLAFTGGMTGWWWLIGLAVVLVGLGLVVLSRRFWRPQVLTAD